VSCMWLYQRRSSSWFPSHRRVFRPRNVSGRGREEKCPSAVNIDSSIRLSQSL
jgi:hypothetical protein